METAAAGAVLFKANRNNPHTVVVSDEESERCLDPEGNGVNLCGGNGGGPGSPGGEQDKQLITSRGGVNTLMEQQEDGKKSPG